MFRKSKGTLDRTFPSVPFPVGLGASNHARDETYHRPSGLAGGLGGEELRAYIHNLSNSGLLFVLDRASLPLLCQ